MHKVKDISDNEMIACFLQAEINSSRFGHNIINKLKKDQKDRALIDNPNLKSDVDNAYRLQLLGDYRGYGKNKSLFQDFPTDVRWERVILTRDDLKKIKYINYDFWIELSQGSRYAKDAVSTIESGKKIFGQNNDSFIKAADAVKSGTVFPEIILIAADEKSDIVVVEGHLRLTAYLLAKEQAPDQLEALIGYSSNITNWGLY